MSSDLKRRSRTITDGRTRAGARAMLKAIGFTDEDLAKPIIGIANTWIETMPCNINLRALAARVKEGVRAAGGTPMEFNTVAIADGVTMGTEGMKASLISRDLIADSIELMGRGYMFDAIIALVACDKTIPGAAMGLTRLNIPGFLLYGGSIAPGHWRGSFREALVGLSEKTQFIVVTHNRGTIEAADTIYGVTMGDDGASRVLSLRLEEVREG